MQPQHAFMTVIFASQVTATFVPPVSAQTIDTSETRVQTARNPGFPRLGTTAPRNVAEIARESWSLGCETLDRGSANYDSHRDCPVPLGIRNTWLQGRE
jgi:hypothetical protein